MDNGKAVFHDALTGKTIERELTEEEAAQLAADQAAAREGDPA